MGTTLAETGRQKKEPVSLTLYELTEEQKALDELIYLQDGEFDEAAEELFNEQAARMATKADDFGRYLRTREAIAAQIKLEEKRLADRRKAIENHVERLKRYAVMALRNMGRTKVEGDTFTLAVQANPPKLNLSVPPEELPEVYVRVVPATIQADTPAILTALKAGVEIRGAEMETGYHLRVR